MYRVKSQVKTTITPASLWSNQIELVSDLQTNCLDLKANRVDLPNGMFTE